MQGNWGLTAASIGSALIWLGVLSFLGAAATSFLSGRNERLASPSRWLFIAGSVCVASCLGILISLFLGQQYGVNYVFRHTKSDYEIWYKLAGCWAGQEGSILLWTIMSALFGLLTLKRFGTYQPIYLGVYSIILMLMMGISAFESPFRPTLDAAGAMVTPPDGRGMNASLLNYWMVIHPPTIFSGFGSLTVLYAIAVAALLKKDLINWGAMVRPFAIVSTSLLGVGLCMGGFWAYETLGWGGFWMWDPVENASFVPWVCAIALVHGLFIQAAQKKSLLMNSVLAALPFVTFCYGTFMTRSGFLGDTSVHSFVKMDPQALGIMIALLGTGIFGFLAAFIPAAIAQSKANAADGKPAVSFLNRATFYNFCIWLMLAMGFAAAFGMSVPLVQSLMSQKPKVVEEPLYNQVFAWLSIPTFIAMAIAPFLNWRGLSFREAVNRILNPLALAIGFTGILMLWCKTGWQGEVFAPGPTASLFFGAIKMDRLSWVMILTFVCLFTLFCTVFRMYEMMPRQRRSIGGMAAHLGIILAVFGLIFSKGLEQKETLLVHPSRPAEAFGYQVSYIAPTRTFTDRHNEVKLMVSGDRSSFTATPGLYYEMGSDGEPQPTIWPHIQRRPLYDLYLTLAPMVFEASDEVPLKRDEQAQYENLLVTYRGYQASGQMGTATATFTADVDIMQLGEVEVVEPSGELSLKGGDYKSATLSDGRTVSVSKMDVDANEATFTLSSAPKEPFTLIMGMSKDIDNTRLRFRKLKTIAGADGQPGRLVAEVSVQTILDQHRVNPSLNVQAGSTPVKVSDDYSLVLSSIDAATKNATFRFDFVQPAFPLEVYYKPLTWTVWLGVGIMTLGGFLAAWNRRSLRKKDSDPESDTPESDASPDHAPLTASEV